MKLVILLRKSPWLSAVKQTSEQTKGLNKAINLWAAAEGHQRGHLDSCLLREPDWRQTNSAHHPPSRHHLGSSENAPARKLDFLLSFLRF